MKIEDVKLPHSYGPEPQIALWIACPDCNDELARKVFCSSCEGMEEKVSFKDLREVAIDLHEAVRDAEDRAKVVKDTEPTQEDRETTEFNAIWQVIRHWDIQRRAGDGYSGATGTDVMEILRALKWATSSKILIRAVMAEKAKQVLEDWDEAIKTTKRDGFHKDIIEIAEGKREAIAEAFERVGLL